MNFKEVKLKLLDTFNDIGRKGKFAPPSDPDNRFAIAWEYYVAKTLKSYAEKREKIAKEQADAAGLLNKPAPGETSMAYKCGSFHIVGKTNQPAVRIDTAKLNVELGKTLGVDAARTLIKKCQVEASPATSFDFVAVEEFENV